jgi:heptaprenylglyceryl phosphate synthase
MKQAFLAGADVVVIGNHFESHPEQIPIFVECKADICR